MTVLNEKQIRFLEDLQTTMQKGAVQPDELTKIIKVLLEVFRNIKVQLEQNIYSSNLGLRKDLNHLLDEIKKLETKTDNAIGNASNKAQQFTLAEVSKIVGQLQTAMAKMKGEMPEMPDLSVLENKMVECEKMCNEIKIPTIDEIENDIPKLGIPIRDALELLPKGEKLNIDAIEDLREELDKVRQIQLTKKDNVVFVGGGGGSGGRITKDYDISSQLNGVLKTFSLPAFYRVISVEFSSAPFSSRRTIDWTTDASAMTITFTSEITASSTLASGNTVSIIYSE